MRKWTAEDHEKLLKLYPHYQNAVVAEMLNKTYGSINSRAFTFKLKKSEAFFASPLSGRINKDNDIGENTRFSKNIPGWNKGKKLTDYVSPESIERMKIGQFKKGGDPHNTVPMFSERITKDGYIEIKVRHTKNGDGKNKNFQLKQRWLWEKENGPIPESSVIGFIDNDPMNIVIENLVLRSKRENLLRNSNGDNSIIKRFMGVRDPELIEKIKSHAPGLIHLKRREVLLNNKINKKDAK